MIRSLLFLICSLVPVMPAQLVTTVPDFVVSDQTGAFVYRPHVSVHPTDGSFVISWGDERYGPSSAGRLAGIGDIFVSRFSTEGSQTLVNSKVGDVHFGFFHDFSMYASCPLLRQNGDIVVVYHVDARTTIENIKFDDIYFSVYSSGGQALILDRQLNRANNLGSGYGYLPMVVQFGPDLLFVYRYYLDGLYHIGATVVDGSTGNLSGDAVVIDNATAGGRGSPDAASNGTRTIITWSDSRLDAQGDIYVQMFSGTQTSGANVKVNTDVGSRYNQYSRVAMNAAGQAVVVWIDSRDHPGGDLYAQRYDATGSAVGQNVKLTTSSSDFFEYPPAVGIDGAGNFVVAWSDSTPGGSWRAKTRAFNANGNPVTDILELTNPASESIQADLSMEQNGRVTYTWLDGRLDADKGRIFAKRALLTVTGAEGQEERLPRDFVLYQNFPNPFNPSTTIAFSLSEAGQVSLSVFDLLGREMADLLQEARPMGQHRVVFAAGSLPSGTYIVRLQSGGRQLMRRINLIR